MKQELLEILCKNPYEFISGEELSKQLSVSRTAIWKHIKELRKRGYDIRSSTNKGYAIFSMVDTYDMKIIKENLNTKIIGKHLIYFEEIDSTNSRAKILAAQGCEDGTAIIANVQTLGRGRLGRQWVSAGDKGIWMTVVLRADIEPELSGLVTLGASVAVVDAIKKVTGIETHIKWPNDIVANGKKLCGILCEMSAEPDRINYLVVGLGINVYHQKGDFPDEIDEIATSLRQMGYITSKEINPTKQNLRNRLAAEILNQLEEIYFILRKDKGYDIISKWKSVSAILGKEVKVTFRDRIITGTAVDITHLGELKVIDNSGTEIIVRSGEAQVRGIMGYNI